MTATVTHHAGDGRTRLLITLEVVLAVAALGGTVALVRDGTSLGRAADDLPFRSTALAGLALGLVNGVLPLAVVVATVRRAHWAPVGHMVVGAALMGWIAVQVAFIGWISLLQPILLAYGFVILAAALSGTGRRSLSVDAGEDDRSRRGDAVAPLDRDRQEVR